MAGGLRFGLLGPVVIHDAEGEPRPVRSPKVRALLAALLLEPGRVVSVEFLKDALWSGAPPVSAHASLQNHATRLRRLLDDPDRLRAVPPGYRLRVGEGELDVRVFERLIGRARAAHAAQDWAGAAQDAADALALWRGTPLCGLPEDLAGHALVPRLEEARLLALEWRHEADLARGLEVARLATELAELVAEHPLREAFHRQLMLALHRTGRQAEALAVHRELRARLVEELGIEPGAGVREAHREVLRTPTGAGAGAAADAAASPVSVSVSVSASASASAESSVSGSAPPSSASPSSASLSSGRPPVAQLPPAPAHFTGRDAVVRGVGEVLAGGGGPGVPRVAVVSGMAGVGKSALALHVAHGLREAFPDGQLYVNLRGATPGMTPLSPKQALTALLRDVGADTRQIPEYGEDPAGAAALLRSLLAPTRTLMVLDDAESAAQVRPLLPGGSGCAVVVTSRSPLAALDGATRFPLEPLTDGDSAALLRAVSGRDGLDAGHPLVGLAGRLPLALRILAARLAARRALTPDALADLLTARGGRLHHLEYDDLSVRRSLAVALDALRASDRRADRDAAAALVHIGALDLPTYGVPLLAALLGTDERAAESALDRLVDVALLDETAYGRYAPHDLVREFARETAREEGGADVVVAAALCWYAGSARQSLLAIMEEGLDREDRLRGVAERLAEGCGGGVLGGGAPGDGAPGDGALGAESLGRGALEVGSVGEGQPGVGSLGRGVDGALGRGVDGALGRSADGVPGRAVDGAPGRAADGALGRGVLGGGALGGGVAEMTTEGAFAWCDTELANILALAGREERERRDSPLVSVLVRCLWSYLVRRGRITEAEALGGIALTVAGRLGDDEARAQALVDLAGLHYISGRSGAALDLNDEALALYRKLDLVSCVHRGSTNRGLLLEALGRDEEAADALRESLDLSKDQGDLLGEAFALSHLGNLYEHTDPRSGITLHERCLEIGAEIGDTNIRQHAHRNIGIARLALGEPEAALDHFEECLRVHGSFENWHNESQARLGLVRALREVARPADAARACADLLELAGQRADAHMEGLARHQRGHLLYAEGRAEEAYEDWRAALAALDGTDSSQVVGELRELLAAPGGGGGNRPL
ncbi:BTAD domain-containing putative transcriptional regulator [Actinomycetota bacterium Odt1-20B]